MINAAPEWDFGDEPRDDNFEQEMIESEKNNTEYHLPGYNFCGPGTKISTRLIRGDKVLYIIYVFRV